MGETTSLDTAGTILKVSFFLLVLASLMSVTATYYVDLKYDALQEADAGTEYEYAQQAYKDAEKLEVSVKYLASVISIVAIFGLVYQSIDVIVDEENSPYVRLGFLVVMGCLLIFWAI